MKHFTKEEDLVILKELISTPPSQATFGALTAVWEGIAERVSATIKRTVTYRVVQNRAGILVKNFKKTEAASLKASGISEVVSEMDILLREYIELSELSAPTKVKPAAQVRSDRDMMLKRYRDKSEHGENASAENLSAAESRISSQSRRPDDKILELVSERFTSSRIAEEEQAAARRQQAKHAEEKLEVERARLAIEHKKAEADEKRAGIEEKKARTEEKRARTEGKRARTEEKRIDLEVEKHREDAELRKGQLEFMKQNQEVMKQNQEVMSVMLSSFLPMFAKLKEKEQS